MPMSLRPLPEGVTSAFAVSSYFTRGHYPQHLDISYCTTLLIIHCWTHYPLLRSPVCCYLLHLLSICTLFIKSLIAKSCLLSCYISGFVLVSFSVSSLVIWFACALRICLPWLDWLPVFWFMLVFVLWLCITPQIKLIFGSSLYESLSSLWEQNCVLCYM